MAMNMNLNSDDEEDKKAEMQKKQNPPEPPAVAVKPTAALVSETFTAPKKSKW